TRFSRDWSSDVCSSDLVSDVWNNVIVDIERWYAWIASTRNCLQGRYVQGLDTKCIMQWLKRHYHANRGTVRIGNQTTFPTALSKIGRASCRERVWSRRG